MMMRRLLVGLILVLGSLSAAQAQQSASSDAASPAGWSAPSPSFSPAPAGFVPSSDVPFASAAALRDPGDLSSAAFPVATAVSVTDSFSGEPGFAAPAPVPSAALPGDPAAAPDPKFLYGGRDDYRWQLGLGASWERFRSNIFNASAVGANASVSFYLNDWLGVEGNILTGFAPEIFDKEHVKLLNFTGGPRIAWRQRQWEPWAHVLVGVAHEQPQTAGHSRNAFAVQAGGGADYRINPRLSLRLEGDWLRSLFFGESQNNFILMGGVVIHF
jgi:opacity protein-like surface antigen